MTADSLTAETLAWVSARMDAELRRAAAAWANGRPLDALAFLRSAEAWRAVLYR